MDAVIPEAKIVDPTKLEKFSEPTFKEDTVMVEAVTVEPINVEKFSVFT